MKAFEYSKGYEKMFVCDVCNTAHLKEEDAVKCCTAWFCDVCGEMFDDQAQADKCCCDLVDTYKRIACENGLSIFASDAIERKMRMDTDYDENQIYAIGLYVQAEYNNFGKAKQDDTGN